MKNEKQHTFKEKELNLTSWDLWTSNFKHAKGFFESKGKVKTCNRLKAEWCQDFHRSLNIIAEIIIKKGKNEKDK